MTKRYPLPKRFNAALSESAYKNLRALNAKYHFGNNYCLTILLENLDRIAKSKELDKVFKEFTAEYGAPGGGKDETVGEIRKGKRQSQRQRRSGKHKVTGEGLNAFDPGPRIPPTRRYQ